MVIRGKSRGDARQLAYYLLSTKENEAVKVMEMRGTSFDDVVKSIQQMGYTSELTNGEKGLFHCQINPAIGEDKNLSYKDWLRMADIAEEEYGLTGQKRVIIQHKKHDRLHIHVVWERFDYEKNILRTDSYTHYKGRVACQRIEDELSLRKTPWRAKEKRDHIKKLIGPLWTKTKSAEGFIGKARELGYEVVTSQNRRPFMVVDETGRSYDLVRAIPGAKTKDVRDRFQHTKLKTDKEVIRGIRAKESEKAFNLMQEKSLDKMDEFKNKQEGRDERKELDRRTEKVRALTSNLKPDKEQQKKDFKESIRRALDKDRDKEK